MIPPPDDIPATVKALGRLTVPELKRRHAEVFGEPARTNHNLYLVKRMPVGCKRSERAGCPRQVSPSSARYRTAAIVVALSRPAHPLPQSILSQSKPTPLPAVLLHSSPHTLPSRSIPCAP